MGKVVYFEIRAANIARAKSFYEAVFGWEFSQWGDQEYWFIKTGEQNEPGIDGGLSVRNGEPPHENQPENGFVCTIDVANIQETITAISKNHGKTVIEPVPIQNIGWMAYCKDTEGNIFGIMQNDASVQ